MIATRPVAEFTVPAIGLGCMNLSHAYAVPPPADVAERLLLTALDEGVTLFDTAALYGFGANETLVGRVLKKHRQKIVLCSKGGMAGVGFADGVKRVINGRPEAIRRNCEDSLQRLQTDHIDLYGWHGINNDDLCRTAIAAGGPVEELLKMQAEGLIGAVGFSTHGPVEVICKAIATGLFSFVNLHYYYFFQRNLAAVQLAAAQDMGVFIISPNDKGGQLFNPPALLRELCAPLTPIQFNARWCLRTPQVQTLTFGMTEAAHITEMLGIFPVSVPLTAAEARIEQGLNARILTDPISAWEGWEYQNDPSGINIPEVLRFRRLWKCYGMEAFGLYRYNMFESKGHWFPGGYATDDAIAKLDPAKAPAGIDVRALLRETHAGLFRAKA